MALDLDLAGLRALARSLGVCFTIALCGAIGLFQPWNSLGQWTPIISSDGLYTSSMWSLSALIAAIASAVICAKFGRLWRQGVGLRVVSLVVVASLALVLICVGATRVGAAFATRDAGVAEPLLAWFDVVLLALRWASLVAAAVALGLRPSLTAFSVIGVGWLLPRAVPALSFVDPAQALGETQSAMGAAADIGAVVSFALAAILLERRAARAP